MNASDLGEREKAMTSRWIAAGAAACAVALLTVPWMLRGAESREEKKLAAPAAASSEKKEPANLDLTLKDMNGAEVRLADYKGKVVILNFWATWCGPCQAEIPELIETYKKYKEQGVVVLGVSVDDTAETLRAYAAEKKMNYPVLLWHEGLDEAYGPLLGVPITFFIGRDGMIHEKHMGPVDKEQVEREIKTLL
jgi:cytochrome c biogenesis protein CcmG, thiol:disulfide interchange protein DsbE